MSSQNDECLDLPPRPDEPQDSDCCGNGCSSCVFDIYDSELRIWEKECARLKCVSVRPSEQMPTLKTEEYVQFEISSIEPHACDNMFIFRFTLPPGYCLGIQIGQHVIVRGFEKNSMPVIRQYSVISPIDAFGYFELLIKLYDTGRMSRVIRDWTVGTKIDIRGPFGDFQYKKGALDRLYILCMGTGLAPFASIMFSILADDEDEVVIKLIFGCKNPESILLQKHLQEWSRFWNFSVVYAFSNPSTSSDIYGHKCYPMRICPELLSSELVLEGSYQILVCGSQDFVNDIKTYCRQHSIPDDRIHIF